MPKTPEERIKELEAENKSLKSENARMEYGYNKVLGELHASRQETDHYKRELSGAKIDSAKLIDTNSRLVRDNMELRKKTGSSSVLDRKAAGDASQDAAVAKKARRKNWFPTDKMAAAGGAVAGVAGTYAVMVGRVSSKEEAFGLACAGAGMTTLALGREVTDKINAWRDKRAEKKDADR